MTNEVQIGNPVYVGELAYQLYRRTWQGRVIFGAQIGKPYVSKKTGEPMLLRSYDEKCLDDVMSAARAAKKQIAKMKQATAGQNAFQQLAERQLPGQRHSNLETPERPEVRCDEPRGVPLARIKPKKVVVQDGKLVPYEKRGGGNR